MHTSSNRLHLRHVLALALACALPFGAATAADAAPPPQPLDVALAGMPVDGMHEGHRLPAGEACAPMGAGVNASEPFGSRHPMPPGPGMPGFDGVPPFLHGVELSEEQRDRIFDISYALVPKLRAQHKLVEHARRDLAALRSADKFDEAKTASLIEAESKAMASIELMRAKADSEIRAVLTPEQRKQIDEHAPRVPRMGRAGESGEPHGA